MEERSLSRAWLPLWESRVSDALKAMTGEFEQLHGYPPGINRVRSADCDDRAAARSLAQTGLAPADLVTFYDDIGDVTWEDVGNGYFVHPAHDVLLSFQEHWPVRIGAGQEAGGLVIGSNGGGLYYVTDTTGAVYRTRTASLDESELDRVTDDLRRFLELLDQSLIWFLANGDPGCV